MQVLGIRSCHVWPPAEAVASTRQAPGLPQRVLDDVFPPGTPGFVGAIFPAGASWVEVWPEGPMHAPNDRICFVKRPGGWQMSFRSARPAAPG
jgi:hypothetical protein